MNIRTAYGSGSPTGDLEPTYRMKLSFISRISDALSIRNEKYKEFLTDLNKLLNQYGF